MWKPYFYDPWNSTMALCTSCAAFWLPVYFYSMLWSQWKLSQTWEVPSLFIHFLCVTSLCMPQRQRDACAVCCLGGELRALSKHNVQTSLHLFFWTGLKEDLWYSVSLNPQQRYSTRPNCNMSDDCAIAVHQGILKYQHIFWIRPALWLSNHSVTWINFFPP